MLTYFLYELKIQSRYASHLIVPILFFLGGLILFPFTVAPQLIDLTSVSIGLVWTVLLLSCFIAPDGFFLEDKNSAFMMRFPFFTIPLEGIFLVKALVFLLVRIFPLIIIMPIIGLLFHWSPEQIIRMMIMVLISSPALVFFSLFGGLLAVALGQSGHWIFMMIFPLIIPILIFGASGCDLQKSLIDVIYFPLAFSGFSIFITMIASHFIFKVIYSGG